ncbi:MAG: cytochrome c3 family protein [Halobacteriota archaeon]
MASKKIVLLAVAVVATGIFALPSAVSLFSGQHSWYDLSAQGNNVPCEKCHAEIGDEMSHTGAHADMECWYCHSTRNLTGVRYASGNGAGSSPGQEAHAASTVECMACHEGFGINITDCLKCHFTGPKAHPTEWFEEPCGNCHAGYTVPHFSASLEAGGFGLTVNTTYDTGEKAAHKKFAFDAMNNSLMEGANEACIACHTRVGVNITWVKNENMVFQAVENATGDWNVSKFAAGGSNTTTVNTSNAWTP